jgi:hypothetical protein
VTPGAKLSVGRACKRSVICSSFWGLGEGFAFEYRHYGPYSEQLAAAARVANLLGLIEEEERQAAWGGFYSVFTMTGVPVAAETNRLRSDLIRITAESDPIELELAATAAFLADEGAPDPWEETAKLKPAKAEGGRLENAQALYRKLQEIETPLRLPRIA